MLCKDVSPWFHPLWRKKHENYTFNSHPLFCQKSSNIWQICSSLRWMWTYIYICTCGLPVSAVAIISGWGRFGNVGYRSSPGPPGGRRTHKVVIHQQRRRRNTAFLKLFLINIWETNPAVDTRSARSLKKFQFCGCKGAPLPKISLPRICPTSQGE